MLDFQIENEPAPQKKKEFLEGVEGTQKVLFSGLNCLPGQQDLFETDGEEPKQT